MTSEDKKAVDLGLLEEDDEFEEFPTEGEKNDFILNCNFINFNWFANFVL